MNERIQQLAEQNFYYGNWEGDGIFTGQLDLEKFAKLIVKECARVANDRDGARYAGTAIEEHFGLKEVD
jgi:hypothetical protein